MAPVRKDGVATVRSGLSVETGAVGRAAEHGLAVAQTERDRAIGLAGHTPDRAPDAVPVDRDFHPVFVLDLQILRGLFAHNHGVIPRQAGNGPGQFLQPGVVAVAAVEYIRVGVERNFVARTAAEAAAAEALDFRLRLPRQGRNPSSSRREPILPPVIEIRARVFLKRQ